MIVLALVVPVAASAVVVSVLVVAVVTVLVSPAVVLLAVVATNGNITYDVVSTNVTIGVAVAVLVPVLVVTVTRWVPPVTAVVRMSHVITAPYSLAFHARRVPISEAVIL